MQPRQPPIDYMQRTREYYRGLGYARAYEWAHFDEIPFTLPKKALARSTIAIVTTAALYRPQFGDQGPGAQYNGKAKFFEVYAAPAADDLDLRISHIAYDRVHTSAADVNTYFPLAALKRARDAGRVGDIANHVFGLPTDRSQAMTLSTYAPAILARCINDQVDAVLLLPNCPVCHQSVSLAARYLEQHGMPCVIFGCARDIVEHCGVARFLFSDFPLGNAAGKPFDLASQDATLEQGLSLLEQATCGGATWLNPERWSDADDWKIDFCNIDRLGAAELERLRTDFEREKAHGKANKG